VTACAVLVLGGLAVIATLAVASERERLVSYPVRGSLNGVTLDLGSADVVIARGGRRDAVDVQRREKFAFGHSADVRKEVDGGVFMLRSRCPRTVLHACSVRYQVTVPDNVPVDVRTDGGSVRLADYRGSARVTTRSGDITVTGFCGFALQARAERGDVTASVDCALKQLSLRSRIGSVRAIVPPGRYRLDAETAAGRRTVRGVSEAGDSPYALQALSSSGDVFVQARP
jgi:hypothetical protein